jgi:hypothetical protein
MDYTQQTPLSYDTVIEADIEKGVNGYYIKR